MEPRKILKSGEFLVSDIESKDIFIPEEMNEEQPVSYTHLRAHETVLDLVCRLLLEKKKHNKHNSD